jgi:hypothetical protein
MATLAAQTLTSVGLAAVYAAADAGGDAFPNNGQCFVHVKNSDASPHTVTVATSRTVDGLAVANRDVVIPAGEERFIGPLSVSTYNDGSGNVQLSYDAVTGVSLAVLLRP